MSEEARPTVYARRKEARDRGGEKKHTLLQEAAAPVL